MKRTERMPGFPGIYRKLFRKGPDEKWREPTRGMKFGVKVGGRRREFFSFQEAKTYWATSRSGQIPLAQESSMLFRELYAQYKSLELPNKAYSTQVKYISYEKHFQTLFDKHVAHIGPATIDALIVHWKSAKYLASSQASRASFEHEFTFLKTLLGFYRERFNRNYVLPFLRAHNKAVVVRKVTKAKKDLTLDDFHRFIESLGELCLGNDWEPMYYLAKTQYFIFGRIQEAAALHFEDIDFERKIVTINKRVIWMRTPGQETKIEHGLKAGTEKEIPLSQSFESLVREWMLRSGRRKGPMFTLYGDLIKYRAIQEKFTQAFRRAQLPQTATHVIRHAGLCEAYETVKDILIVQKLAGHKDLESTSRYAKAREKNVREAVDKLDLKIEAFREQFEGRKRTQV
jgi:integrase